MYEGISMQITMFKMTAVKAEYIYYIYIYFVHTQKMAFYESFFLRGMEEVLWQKVI